MQEWHHAILKSAGLDLITLIGRDLTCTYDTAMGGTWQTEVYSVTGVHFNGGELKVILGGDDAPCDNDNLAQPFLRYNAQRGDWRLFEAFHERVNTLLETRVRWFGGQKVRITWL